VGKIGIMLLSVVAIQEIQNSQTTTSSNALFHKQESQRQAPANR